jgi:electron transfer flavoprotein-quinone oxidoreductase
MLREWYKHKKPHKLQKPLSTANPSDPPSVKKYDVIVVGAGPAGATAAYFMARDGLDVLLLERGPYPGAKNAGGSAILAEHTHKLFPNFWEELEWERIVTSQGYWWLTEDSAIIMSFASMRLAAAPYNRFTVKRRNLYKWLAAKAVSAGATLLLNHHVTEVLFDGKNAVGVAVSPPQNGRFLADIIVLADGANSMLAERAHLAPKVSANNMALFVKETIALSPDIIEERFNLQPNHGALIGLIGFPTAGFNGTASIHTFKDSLNINVGMTVSNFSTAGFNPHDLLLRIKKHPHIEPLLAGGVTTEYGSQMIPEGGYHAIPHLVHPGLMIVGDAASLVNGTHGYNLAMWSGYYAAKAAYSAKANKDFSKKRLSLYSTLLNESFVIQNLKINAKAAALQREKPYLFDLYSRMANEAAYYISRVYTMPVKAKRKFVWQKVTSMQPPLKIIKDIWSVLRVILG